MEKVISLINLTVRHKMAYKFITLLFGVLITGVFGVPFLEDPKPFIIGGEDAPIAYAPHMAGLVFGYRLQYLMCGGSIISRKLVLTAGHCIESLISENGELWSSLHVRVGSNKWNSGGILAEIKNYYIHPQWDSKNIKYDAGVLGLKEKLVLTEYVGIIDLAYDFVDGNEKSYITGWGRTGPRYQDDVLHMAPTPDDLQLLYVNTISHEQCQKQMALIAGAAALPIQREIEICTFHSDRHGLCSGDSGSALVRSSTNQQIGIVSWGYNCADGAPDVSARIHGLKDFLESVWTDYKD